MFYSYSVNLKDTTVMARTKRIPAITIPPGPDVGKILKDFIKTNRKYKSGIARWMGVASSGVAGYTKRKNMEVYTLWRMCHVLKKDFFADISAQLPAEFSPAPPVQNQQEFEQLKLKVRQLEIEVSTLKEALKLVSGK